MVIRLPRVVVDPQIGFDHRPVLLQIVVRLLVQTVRQSLAEEKRTPTSSSVKTTV